MVQVKEFNKKSKPTVEKARAEELAKKMRKESEKMVSGMFEFLDAQGGWLEFVYHVLPGDPYQTLKIYHGEICDLPMGIVKHLNNTRKKVRKFDMSSPEKAGPMDRRGVPSTYEVISRVRFTPLDVLPTDVGIRSAA